MASSTIPGRALTANGILGNPPPPTLSDFEPHHGEAHSLVTIFGTNLTSVKLVQFNGFDAAISPGGNDSQIVVTVPDLATTGHIVISDGTNRITSADIFMVDPPRPEVNTVSPAAAVPGTTLTFTGRHLATVSSVVFNCANGSFSAAPKGLMPKSFKADVPNAAGPGPARIIITNPFGTTGINFKVKR
ncbi:MAG TPA: IPT/TIG domain-containing protein [Xanthomonadales bacterium]|nr:IPT/TIG domain-containing protein [Xanthomonadales bacterium]